MDELKKSMDDLIKMKKMVHNKAKIEINEERNINLSNDLDCKNGTLKELLQRKMEKYDEIKFNNNKDVNLALYDYNNFLDVAYLYSEIKVNVLCLEYAVADIMGLKKDENILNICRMMEDDLNNFTNKISKSLDQLNEEFIKKHPVLKELNK